MRIVSTTGAKSLQHNGVTYALADGENAFEVPENVGEELVRFPHWKREYQADPSAASMSERIRQLEEQSAAQGPSEAEAALLARVAELEAKLAQTHTPAQGRPAAKTAVKKSAAAKKTTEHPAREDTPSSGGDEENGDDGGE